MILIKRAVFLWILISGLCIVGKSAQASQSDTVNEKTHSGVVLGRYEEGGRRDPFDSLERPKVAQASLSGLSGVRTVDDLNIEGIVLDPPGGSFVMVNGVILRQGETQEGVKALQIQPTGVTFEIQGSVAFKPYDPMTHE